MHCLFNGLCFTHAAEGMPFSHDTVYVVVSFIIAAVGAYTALDLAERRREASGKLAWFWQLGAAATLGGSIWAMHFMGMLAFRIDLPISYDVGLTAASLGLAVVSAGIGLEIVVGGKTNRWIRLPLGALALGLGIAAMHYIGMRALLIGGSVAYLGGRWTLSVVIALVSALASLWFFERGTGPRSHIIASLGMACGICGMHYMGMAATVIRYDPFVHEAAGIQPEPLALGIVIATTALLLMALSSAGADRKMMAGVRREEATLRRSNEELRQSQREIITRLCHANELKDDNTGLHSRRMAMVAYQLSLAAGYDAAFADRVLEAAPLHDIGKIGIADSILLKPGNLSAGERTTMERHAELGATMLSGSSMPLLQLAATIAGGHHERWDGSGYPLGLTSEAIPISARIVAIADVFDALMSKRPYKPAWELEQITSFFRAQSGQHFDPHLVQVFLDNFRYFVHLWRQFTVEVRTPA